MVGAEKVVCSRSSHRRISAHSRKVLFYKAPTHRGNKPFSSVSTKQPFKPVIPNSIKLSWFEDSKTRSVYITSIQMTLPWNLAISVSLGNFIWSGFHSIPLGSSFLFPLVILSNVLFLFCQEENKSHFHTIKEISFSYTLQSPTIALFALAFTSAKVLFSIAW